MSWCIRRSRVLFATSFRDKKISDCYQLLLTKKPPTFDYVAIDATALVATGLRMCKHAATEQRRHKEVARHVAQNIQQFLRKVHCKKSLLITLDGAESVLKAHLTRSSALTKKQENRLVRLPGTPLMRVVEERIVRMIPDRHITCGEVVVSGARVPGSSEEKISGWALDLACDPAHSSDRETLTMVGPSELFMNVAGLTPYFHISSLVQSGGDLKQIRWLDISEWLELNPLAARGDSLRVARSRTDALFLYMISSGCSATDLPAIHGGSFSYLYHRYCELNGYGSADPSNPRGESVAAERTSSGNVEAEENYLFDDIPGGELRLSLTVLHRLFQSSTSRMKEEKDGKADPAVESYLAHALQSHAMLCLGKTVNPGLLPYYQLSTSLKSNASTITAAQMVSHLRYMVQKGDVYASRTASSFSDSGLSEFCSWKNVEAESASGTVPAEPHPHHLWSPHQRMTAAEFTMLSYSQAHMLESAIQQYVGTPPKPEVPKRIAEEKRAVSARLLVQEVLSYSNPDQPHPCLCFSPSFLWTKNDKTGVWSFAYIDVGAHSLKKEIRRCHNAQSGLSMSMGEGSAEGPTVFLKTEFKWVPLPPCPVSAAAQQDLKRATDEKADSDPAGETVKVLSWNVMFDRYSGQPTPLGMPGIDWCSPQRYPVLCNCIDREDADVVGLQEVEPAFAKYLSQQSWCREKYILSCTPSSAALDPWGVLMLIRRGRFTLEQLTHVNVPAWSGHVSLMPIVSLSLGRRQTLDIAAVHLIAPFTKANESARTGQDAALRQRAVKNLSPDAIVMGDFNDWPGNEFEMPPDTLYRDCWPLLHPEDPGKTMDDTNTFCKLKVEEMFFGRSDKIFVRSRKLRPKEAHLVGTKSVNAENSNTDAPAYLFPSDHYGVCMTFHISG